MSYVLISFLSNRIALHDARNPMVVVIGAMLVRVVVTLGLLVIALRWLPVAPTGLLGGFFATFLIGLAIEIRFFNRKQPPTS